MKLFWHMHTNMLLPNPIFPCLQEVNCWHDLDNTEYDCWPINSPNDYNMISCGGEFFIHVFAWLPLLIFFFQKKIRCFLSWLRINVKIFNTLSCWSSTAYIYSVRNASDQAARVLWQVWKWPGCSVLQRKSPMGRSSMSRTLWRPQILFMSTLSETGSSSSGKCVTYTPGISNVCHAQNANTQTHTHRQLMLWKKKTRKKKIFFFLAVTVMVYLFDTVRCHF